MSAVDMPEIDKALDAESWEWLQDEEPLLATAVAAEVKAGRTPEQIRRHVLRKAGGHRYALAARCYGRIAPRSTARTE